jgi:hypothetical protein
VWRAELATGRSDGDDGNLSGVPCGCGAGGGAAVDATAAGRRGLDGVREPAGSRRPGGAGGPAARRPRTGRDRIRHVQRPMLAGRRARWDGGVGVELRRRVRARWRAGSGCQRPGGGPGRDACQPHAGGDPPRGGVGCGRRAEGGHSRAAWGRAGARLYLRRGRGVRAAGRAGRDGAAGRAGRCRPATRPGHRSAGRRAGRAAVGCGIRVPAAGGAVPSGDCGADRRRRGCAPSGPGPGRCT